MDFITTAAISRDNTRLSKPLRLAAMLTAVLIILTSSFDIFLVLHAGGNYRFCQLIAPVLVVLAGLRAARGLKLPMLGAVPLCIWLLFQICFIPATGFWPKSAGYCFWLLLNIVIVYSFVYLFSDDRRALIIIVRWYAWSFAVVAICGVIQFCLPLAGLPPLFVEQWWTPDRIPRVNGFSYEPSYLATYLLIGFVFASSLRRARIGLLSSKALLVIYWLTLIGIVLSSSRMGIVFVIAEILLAQTGPWLHFMRDLIRLRIVRRRLHSLIPSSITIALLAAVIAGAVDTLENNPATMFLLLNGTGVSDTAAHSVIERENILEDTLRVFKEHPLVGRSLGGVSYAIGRLHGEDLHSFEASKDFEGMNIFAEVLAASGVVGVIPFLCFVIATIRKPLQLARTAGRPYAALLRALVRSLLFGLAILQLNQNILRPYLWVHLAILAAVYAGALQATLRTEPAIISQTVCR